MNRIDRSILLRLQADSSRPLSRLADEVGLSPSACHLLAGRADYLMQLTVADMAEFERIHREKLSRLPGVATMTTSFSLRTVKRFRGYPIEGMII